MIRFKLDEAVEYFVDTQLTHQVVGQGHVVVILCGLRYKIIRQGATGLGENVD